MVRIDPENNESKVLMDLMDFDGKQVLEIGSGDGRLTWLYANAAAEVTAIEPYAGSNAVARENLPDELEGRVEFKNIGFEEFAAGSEPSAFDVVILSWALC